jgi:hypothetical protein
MAKTEMAKTEMGLFDLDPIALDPIANPDLQANATRLGDLLTRFHTVGGSQGIDIHTT